MASRQREIELSIYGRENLRWKVGKQLRVNDRTLLHVPISETASIDLDDLQAIVSKVRFFQGANGVDILYLPLPGHSSSGIILESPSIQTGDEANAWKISAFRSSKGQYEAVGHLKLPSDVELIRSILTVQSFHDDVRLRRAITNPQYLSDHLKETLPTSVAKAYSNDLAAIDGSSTAKINPWVVVAVAVGVTAIAVACIVTDIDVVSDGTEFHC